MKRALGPHQVHVDADGDVLAIAARLLERAPETSAARDTIVVRAARGCPLLPAGPAAFHVGRTRAWITAEADIVLHGRGRSMRIRGADVELWLEPGARRSDEEIEEIALVDLACALFLAARAYHTWHIHAACVVDPVLGPLLIAGQSGSGKSTTTIALIARGARWLADDTVLARREGDNIRVFGVPRLFHVTPRTLELFPALADACVPGRRSLAGKSCLDPEQAFPGAQEQRGVVPKLVVLPEVRGERTAGRPAQAADALGALIESSTWVTIDDLPGNDEHLAALAQLAGNVRAVQLALAPDAMAPGDPVRAAIAQAVSSAG